MKIKEYIKELLLTNQGVIIPGLGGFVSEYEPAVFDVNENKFLPPSKKITFNAELNYQDNLLIDFTAKKENIDQKQAKLLIEDFVKDCLSKLNKGDGIEFPEIGILVKKGKVFSFTQSKESNLLTDSFGLSSVKTEPTKKEKSDVTKVKSVPQRSYKRLVIISSLAGLSLSLVVISWFLTNGFTNFQRTETTPAKPSLEEEMSAYNRARILDSIAQADSLKAIINESIDENTDIKDALFYTEPKKESDKPEYSAYHIIAGSFKKIENAEIFSEELKKKGYEPTIIQSGDNLFRIAIYTYTDETVALKELYKLRQNSDIPSVWILKTI